MNIGIVGPGALGCLLAARLHLAGYAPVLIDYKENRAALLNRHGVIFSSNEEKVHIPVKTALPDKIEEDFDIIVFCVKSYSLQKSIELCDSLLQKCRLALFMQNGISHLHPQLKNTTACFASTTEGVSLKNTGEVIHAGQGQTFLGFLNPPSPQEQQLLTHFCTVLCKSNISTELTSFIKDIIWKKLLINVGINGLTAIYNCPNGHLLKEPEIRRRMQDAVEEAKKVAAAYNISLRKEPLEEVFEVCQKTAANISSMLQDIRLNRRTEIDAINGALLKLAEKKGISCPENEKIVEQVKILSKRGTLNS